MSISTHHILLTLVESIRCLSYILVQLQLYIHKVYKARYSDNRIGVIHFQIFITPLQPLIVNPYIETLSGALEMQFLLTIYSCYFYKH